MGESTLCILPSFPCTSMLALSIPMLDAFSNRCTSESQSVDDESRWTAVRPASPLPMTAIRVLDRCVSIVNGWIWAMLSVQSGREEAFVAVAVSS